MEFLKTVLGGSCGAAMVAGTFALLQWRLNRRAQREDRADAREAADCAARGREIRELKEMVQVLVVADRAILYDRIKHLGRSYIARGYATIEELEDLDRMHAVYHDKDKLGGNGFLDNLMGAVHALEIRAL